MKKNETYACYEIAKLIYPDTEKICAAAKIVFKLTGMNNGSAQSYINSFFSMKDGEKLKWCMAEEDAKYYFTHIYSDFGRDGLKKALDSFQKYLDYDEQNHPGLQAVIDEFSQKYELN